MATVGAVAKSCNAKVGVDAKSAKLKVHVRAKSVNVKVGAKSAKVKVGATSCKIPSDLFMERASDNLWLISFGVIGKVFAGDGKLYSTDVAGASRF